MIQSQTDSRKPSLTERSEPPRAVLPRWVHVLLGVKPADQQVVEPKPRPGDENRGVPVGPCCRSNPR